MKIARWFIVIVGGALVALWVIAAFGSRTPVLRKALLAALRDILRGQSNAMLSLDEVRARLNVRGQRYLGLRAVPVDHIVGSEGRYSDFDRRFLPRSNVLRQRWSGISRLMREHRELPPVDLWKIGDVYFVRDGNHRVSVARQLGRSYIDAEVTELLVDVPLAPDLSVRDLLRKEEHSDFLEWTNLHQLRPDERIELTALGGYLDIVRHINAHRAKLASQRGREVGRDEAVADWYDTVYLPIVELIRAHGLLRQFSNRTEADLYHWIMEQCDAARTGPGAAPDVQSASTYLAQRARGGLARSFEETLRDVLELIGAR